MTALSAEPVGILPLRQDPGEDAVPGTIENPVMICPVCDVEYGATDMTWMGTVSVSDLTDDEIEEFAEVLIAQMLEVTRRQSRKDGLT